MLSERKKRTTLCKLHFTVVIISFKACDVSFNSYGILFKSCCKIQFEVDLEVPLLINRLILSLIWIYLVSKRGIETSDFYAHLQITYELKPPINHASFKEPIL